MAQTYDGLSMIAEVRGDWAGCQRQLKLWLSYDPKSNLGMQRMAWCVFQESTPEVALEWLKAAAKDNPKLLTPEAILAGYYQRTGDRDNARKWYLAALKAAAKDVPTHVTVGPGPWTPANSTWQRPRPTPPRSSTPTRWTP